MAITKVPAELSATAITITTAAQPNITSVGTLTSLGLSGNITLGDNNKAIFGAGSDLQIYHDGSNSYIQDAGTGNLYIEGTNLILRAADDSRYLQAVDGASGYTALYHPATDGQKLVTTSTGINVTGTISSGAITSSGAMTINEGNAFTDLNIKSDRTSGNIGGVNFVNASNAVKGQIYGHTDGTVRIASGGSTVALTLNGSQNATFAGTISSGDISITKDGNASISLQDTGHGIGASSLALENGGRDLRMTVSQDIIFDTGSEVMRIDNDERVLIGKSSADNTSVGFRFDSATGFSSFVRDGGEPLYLNRKTSDGDVIKIAKDGTVVGVIGTQNWGIGTSSPNTALHVLSDGAGEQAVARFQNTNTNSHNLYIKVDDDNNLVQFQSTGSNNGGFKFTGGNTDIVHISSAGKVVVSPIQSTTNSSQLLNVVNNGEAGIGIESPNGSSPRTWELIVGGSGGVFAGGKFGIFNRTASTAAITVDGNNNVVFSSTIDADSINIDGQAAGGNVLTFENNSWIAIKDGSGTHRRSMGASGDSLYIGDVDNQFDATYLIGQQRPDTTMTVTSYGGGAPDYNNSMMLSGNNSQNLWLLVDAANNTWGLYHRNIDSTETYSTDEPLRPNSIAWVGQGRLSGYFTLENKIGGATTQASYVRGGLAGVYHDYKFKSDTGFEIGKGDDGEPVHTPTINERSSASTGVNATVGNGSPGVYWLNFNGKRFRAYIRPNWLQGRNWVLAAKWFSHTDMPSGSSYWTNDTYHNEGDFNILSGLWSKYLSWRYFSFDRLAMQMGDRVAPIMQFGSAQTLYGAFSGGRAANGGGVSPTSTDPALSTGATYHGMTNFMGGTFTDLGGLEDKMQSYGLNKWANNSLNGTSANNQGSRSLTAGGKGFELTIEDSHDNISGNNSIGFAGAWIGCPLDESNCNPLATSSNAGADSGFGLGGGCGNNARTWTSGIAEWSRGNEVANYHPAYVWLSID